jgi:hypothetical protein
VVLLVVLYAMRRARVGRTRAEERRERQQGKDDE